MSVNSLLASSTAWTHRLSVIVGKAQDAAALYSWHSAAGRAQVRELLDAAYPSFTSDLDAVAREIDGPSATPDRPSRTSADELVVGLVARALVEIEDGSPAADTIDRVSTDIAAALHRLIERIEG